MPETTNSRYLARRNAELKRRELELLEVALQLAESDGLHKVSPGEVAKHSDYSRATVYKVWSSREDLLAACATRSIELQIAMYKQILPRWTNQVEALFIFSLAYLWHVRNNSTLFHLSLAGRSNENLAGCSEASREQRIEAESRLTEIIMSVAQSRSTPNAYQSELPILDSINAVRAMLTGFGLFSTNIGSSAWKEGLTDSQTSKIIMKVMTGLGWNTDDLDIDSIRSDLRKQLEALDEF